jgi:hypothetical protein
MKDIIELIYITTQHQLPILNGRGQPLEKDTLIWRLFEGIRKGQFTSDEEAEKSLYPKEKGGANYRRLKASLRDRMLSTIALFEATSDNFSDYQRAYYDCHREWHIIKILIGQNANVAAMELAVKLLKKSQKYEFTLITMDLASYLAYQYGLRESNDKKFKEANALYNQSRRINDAECLAEQLYNQLMVKVVNNRTANERVAQLAKSFYQQIEKQLKTYSSYRLHLYGNMLAILQYSSTHHFNEIIPICNQAISFFESKPYVARIPLQLFYYHKMIGHIQLKNFEEGKQVMQYCLSMVDEGTFNWFRYMELYVKLGFYTKEYEHGASIVQEVVSHPRFQFLPENVKEIWLIYKSFVSYLVKINFVRNGFLDFKLSKFINDTPIYAKDKSGMNIAIMVVRTIYLLAEKRYQQVLDNVEGMDRYCSRHLRGENLSRSYNFLKMLLQIPLGHFDPQLIEVKAARYYSNLIEFPIQLSDQSYEIEVIPYEDLWEMTLNTIKSNQGNPILFDNTPR